jgi:hypothetical protein
MSREVCFIKSGMVDAFEDAELHKLDHTIERGLTGDIAFFMGIVQPFAITAGTSSDVILQTITKEAYEEILEQFSEGHSVVVANLVLKHGLDRNGDEIITHARSAKKTGKNKEKTSDDTLRKMLQATLKKRTCFFLPRA